MNGKPLIQYFQNISPLSDGEEAAICKSLLIKSFKKGDVLLREGQVSEECYFVLKGCVREYYLANGEEKTTQFYTENQWAISFASFSQKIPAAHFFECTEETELVIGTEQKENNLFSQFPRLESISRKVMEKILTEQQLKIASQQTETPQERYLHLLQSRPELLQRVPQYQLASYIGIKPESLSRIRKRLAKKRN